MHGVGSRKTQRDIVNSNEYNFLFRMKYIMRMKCRIVRRKYTQSDTPFAKQECEEDERNTNNVRNQFYQIYKKL